MIKHSRDYYAETSQVEVNERNDCSVRALATAAAIDYKVAHALYEKHGRKARHGTYVRTTAALLKAEYGIELKTVATDARFYSVSFSPTLAQFVRLHSQGHYLVMTCNHAFAVCDGVVHDWKPRPRCRVRWYAKLC